MSWARVGARCQVSERLSDIRDELPENIEGGLAPISTPLSDILMFTIESDTLSLEEKRSLLDWIITPKIRAVSGVAEVNPLGGKVKTYEVVPDLANMRAMGITLTQIFQALQENNQDDGADPRTMQSSMGTSSYFTRNLDKQDSSSSYEVNKGNEGTNDVQLVVQRTELEKLLISLGIPLHHAQPLILEDLQASQLKYLTSRELKTYVTDSVSRKKLWNYIQSL